MDKHLEDKPAPANDQAPCSGQRLVTYKYECILILVGNRCYQQDEQALDGLH